jgi:hypothetical protein
MHDQAINGLKMKRYDRIIGTDENLTGVTATL